LGCGRTRRGGSPVKQQKLEGNEKFRVAKLWLKAV